MPEGEPPPAIMHAIQTTTEEGTLFAIHIEAVAAIKRIGDEYWIYVPGGPITMKGSDGLEVLSAWRSLHGIPDGTG